MTAFGGLVRRSVSAAGISPEIGTNNGKAGVARISYGPAAYALVMQNLQDAATLALQ